MKKLTFLAGFVAYFAFAAIAFAAPSASPGSIQLTNPNVGYADISQFINAALRLAFIISLLIVLVMLVWGAIQWILSGGDKDAIEAARNRIIHALVGLAILAVAFALVNLAGTFVGIDLLGKFTIPTPGSPTPTLPSN